jgi:hypothetical protein
VNIDVNTCRRSPVVAMFILRRMLMMFVIILVLYTAGGSQSDDNQEQKCSEYVPYIFHNNTFILICYRKTLPIIKPVLIQPFGKGRRKVWSIFPESPGY